MKAKIVEIFELQTSLWDLGVIINGLIRLKGLNNLRPNGWRRRFDNLQKLTTDRMRSYQLNSAFYPANDAYSLQNSIDFLGGYRQGVLYTHLGNGDISVIGKVYEG